MATTYHSDIQKLYVAYFNRPADTAGLNYWDKIVSASNGDTTAVAAAFATSAEYVARFAGMNAHAIVDQVYQNLFGRSAELSGLNYWAGMLDDGLLTIDRIVKNIADGAQGSDLTSFANKAKVALDFTAALDTVSDIAGYSGADVLRAANAFLNTITSDATLPSSIDSIIATLLGSTFSGFQAAIPALTIMGGAGDDTFSIAVTSAAAAGGSSLNGGLGNDKIILSVTTVENHATLTYSNGLFGNDVVVNFAAGNGVGSDQLNFSALGGVAAGFAGAVISNAHGAITIQAETSANDSPAEIAALYTDGNVNAAHIYVAYNADNIGKIYRVIDPAASAVSVTLVGTIDLDDTAWGTLVAANFV